MRHKAKQLPDTSLLVEGLAHHFDDVELLLR